ncbi:WD40 repeat domain-containing serine/threonine protein kinase [Nocardiopsis mangrovi]|uniref:WD40 repeat domain-containing serine/threonine protein kinase n=1 Tax=Nocardiopsis mangrovi TaxID=1179818 RepID=A0ABV9E6Z5_9ACTN
MKPLTASDPKTIGHYTLLSRLGAGGMGLVYLGRSPGNRLVAIKVIRSDHAAEEGYRQRFAREAEMARRVSGHFSAAVIEADAAAETPWLAVEYIPGPSLSEVVKKKGPLPAESLHTLALGLAEALRAVHDAGLVHRDLKPGNVLLTADGPRLIDFGLARTTEAGGMTRTGQLMGTPGYMSPEQTYGHEVSFPSDVFALGGVLYFAATGRDPFGEGPAPVLLYRIASIEPDLSALPPAARGLVAACMAKDPADRPTATDLLDRIAPSAEGPDTLWLPAEALAEVRSAERLSSGLAARRRPLRERRRRWPIVAGAAGAALVLTAAGAFARAGLMGDGGDAPDAAEASPPADRATPQAPTGPGAPASALTPDDIGGPTTVLADPGGRNITELEFNPRRDDTITAGGPELVQAWNLDTGLLDSDMVLPGEAGAYSFAFTPEPVGRWKIRAAIGFLDGRVEYASDHEGLLEAQAYREGVHVTDLEFSADGETLAAGGGDGVVTTWDMTEDDLPRIARASAAQIGAYSEFRTRLSWSPDGAWVATAGGDTPTIIDPGNGEVLDAIPAPDRVLDIAVSPAGSTIATSGLGHAVELWEVGAGDGPQRYASLRGNEGAIDRIAFNHDGSLLVSVGFSEPEDDPEEAAYLGPEFDPSVRLWNVADQEEIAVLDTGVDAPPTVAVFSPDGSRLAVGHHSGEIAVWDLT